MAKPLDPKEIVTVQELAVCNMLELETLSQLLSEKGIIGEEDFWLDLRSLIGRRRRKGEEDELLDMMERMEVREDTPLSQPARLRLQDYLGNFLLAIVS